MQLNMIHITKKNLLIHMPVMRGVLVIDCDAADAHRSTTIIATPNLGTDYGSSMVAQYDAQL